MPRLGAELLEPVRPSAPGQLVQRPLERIAGAGLPGAAGRQRRLEHRELLARSGQVMFEELAIDRFLARFRRCGLVFAGHERS